MRKEELVGEQGCGEDKRQDHLEVTEIRRHEVQACHLEDERGKEHTMNRDVDQRTSTSRVLRIRLPRRQR